MPTQEWREENVDKMRQYRRDWYKRNSPAEIPKAAARRKAVRAEMKVWLAQFNLPSSVRSRALSNGWSKDRVLRGLKSHTG